MPCNGEIIKDAAEQFPKVQVHIKRANLLCTGCALIHVVCKGAVNDILYYLW